MKHLSCNPSWKKNRHVKAIRKLSSRNATTAAGDEDKCFWKINKMFGASLLYQMAMHSRNNKRMAAAEERDSAFFSTVIYHDVSSLWNEFAKTPSFLV